MIFRFERPTSRKSAKCNRNTRHFWCHRINIGSRYQVSMTCVNMDWTLDWQTGIWIALWTLDQTLKWNSNPEQCINAPGCQCRMNFSKCTANSPSTLVRASLVTRAGRHRVLKCRHFFCPRPRPRVELSDWLTPLINTLFARGDHVWAKYSGQMM